MGLPQRKAEEAQDSLAIFQQSVIFAKISDELKQQIAEHLEIKYFRQDEDIVLEDTPSEGLYIIQQGRVQVLKRNEELHLSIGIAKLSTGESFGEMALLTGERRNATVRALEDCSCYFLSNETFAKLLKSFPTISIGVAIALAHRLSEQNKTRRIDLHKLSEFRFRPEIYALIPEEILRRHKAIPLHLQGNTLTIALVNPEDSLATDELSRGLRRTDLQPVAISEKDYLQFMKTHFGK